MLRRYATMMVVCRAGDDSADEHDDASSIQLVTLVCFYGLAFAERRRSYTTAPPDVVSHTLSPTALRHFICDDRLANYQNYRLGVG